MTDNSIPIPPRVARLGLDRLPAIVADAGERAGRRFIEFFTANIRNRNTRLAYARAVAQFFDWAAECGHTLETIEPVTVAAYIERLQSTHAAPTVKQHLAAIRVLYDWLVVGQVVPHNPASSVRGPRHVVKRGKTPVLTADQARRLLDSIDTSTLVGLRDRALIGVMVYTFARVGAVVAMRVEDYFQDGKRFWLRLHEKGGKRHEVPAHHNADAYLDAYLSAAGIAGGATGGMARRDGGGAAASPGAAAAPVSDKKAPLFRSLDRERRLTTRPLSRIDVLRMIKRRARAAGLPATTSCHTFRATGITAYLDNGGTIENAQAIAAHESPRTTKLYDRTGDEITLDEVERIAI